jgi:hypothetical protein
MIKKPATPLKSNWRRRLLEPGSMYANADEGQNKHTKIPPRHKVR